MCVSAMPSDVNRDPEPSGYTPGGLTSRGAMRLSFGYQSCLEPLHVTEATQEIQIRALTLYAISFLYIHSETRGAIGIWDMAYV